MNDGRSCSSCRNRGGCPTPYTCQVPLVEPAKPIASAALGWLAALVIAVASAGLFLLFHP